MTDEFGKLWFVDKDVCAVLGYANARDVLLHMQTKGYYES